jgi:hypothetical protein
VYRASTFRGNCNGSFVGIHCPGGVFEALYGAFSVPTINKNPTVALQMSVLQSTCRE